MISNNESTCPNCGGQLKYYDKVNRIIRSKQRSTKWIRIRRMKCQVCGGLHRELPGDIFPYKQYEAEIIPYKHVGAVIIRCVSEGLITCETIGYDYYPCEVTMIRWISQKIQLPL